MASIRIMVCYKCLQNAATGYNKFNSRGRLDRDDDVLSHDANIAK